MADKLLQMIMKILIVLSTLLAFAAAWPNFKTQEQQEQFIQSILSNVMEEGTYHYYTMHGS